MSTKTIEGWSCPLTDGCHCGKESHPVAPAHWMVHSMLIGQEPQETECLITRVRSPVDVVQSPRPTLAFCHVYSSHLGATELLKMTIVPFSGLLHNVVTSISELLHAEAHKNHLCIKASHLYLGSQGDLLIKSARNELLGIICRASN